MFFSKIKILPKNWKMLIKRMKSESTKNMIFTSVHFKTWLKKWLKVSLTLGCTVISFH